MKIELYIPGLEDYKYEAKVLKDKKTMSYNAGYEVNYQGYDYQTGCIDFTKDKWQDKFRSRKNNNQFFAYIKDIENNIFVGFVNYQYSEKEKRYYCGVVIEHKYRGYGYGTTALKLLCAKANENGIKELYDSFESDRTNTINLFLHNGFKVVSKKTIKKYGENKEGILVKKIL